MGFSSSGSAGERRFDHQDVHFEMTPLDSNVKLVAFSDDGVTVRITNLDTGATQLGLKNYGKGQALPNLSQSLKLVNSSFTPYQRYRIDISYLNTYYTGDGDIDGCKMFIIGGLVSLAEKYDVRIEKCPAGFIPKGGNEDNSVSITAKVNNDNITGTFIFKLVGVSEEPGYCLNAPAKDQLPAAGLEDSTRWSDLQFTPNQPGFTISEDRMTATSQVPSNKETVKISCYDYGAFGRITVDFVENDRTHHAKEEGGNINFTRIPLDDDKNLIADGAAQNKGPGDNFKKDDDLDDSPLGELMNPPDTKTQYYGDGITRYQEYRGFNVNGKHTRSDVTKKEVLYGDDTEKLPQDDWTSENLGVTIYKFSKSKKEWDDRSVSFNQTKATSSTSAFAIIQTLADGLERLDRWGGYSDYGPPKFVKQCLVFYDDLDRGLFSSTTIKQPVQPNQTSIVLKRPGWLEDSDIRFFAMPGKFKINEETITYTKIEFIKEAGYGDKVILLTGVTRGADVRHDPGDVVKLFVDAEDFAKLVVAHEAGHAVCLGHDFTDKSIMTPGKFGIFDYSHKFRKNGVIPGSTQQFRLTGPKATNRK